MDTKTTISVEIVSQIDTLRGQPELGVLFDLNGFVGEPFGGEAWQFVLRTIQPSSLGCCYMFCGVVGIPVGRRPCAFCIGVGVIPGIHGELRALRNFAETFWASDSALLAPRNRRLIVGDSLIDEHRLLMSFWVMPPQELPTGPSRGRVWTTDQSFSWLVQLASECGWGRGVTSKR